MNEGEQGSQSPEGRAAAHHGGEIDVEKLAEKVYHLMMKELRLERARGAGGAGRRMQG
jgi:hypothetical protein